MGNINNVYTAPSRPGLSKSETSPPPSPRSAPAETKNETVGSMNGILGTAKQAVVGMVEAIAPGTTTLAEETSIAKPAVESPQGGNEVKVGACVYLARLYGRLILILMSTDRA